MNVLVIADHDNAALKPSTLTTVTAAAMLASQVHVLVAGYQCRLVAEAAARIYGIASVIHIDAEHYRDGLAEELAPLIAGMGHDYSHLLVPATTFGKDLMPRVAAMLGVAAISDIIEIISADTFVRPIYAGNALATVQSSDGVKVLTVRTTAFVPAATNCDPVSIDNRPALPAVRLSALLSQKLTDSSRPELTMARVVISAGGGLGSLQNFYLLEQLADRLGGAIGGSRAAVEAGYIPNDYLIGQSGKIVAPDLYLAVGISGAIEHLAGMKDSKIIVAINKDEYAPLIEIADYALVGDLNEVLPELLEMLG